jgi:hypothetical protein
MNYVINGKYNNYYVNVDKKEILTKHNCLIIINLEKPKTTISLDGVTKKEVDLIQPWLKNVINNVIISRTNYYSVNLEINIQYISTSFQVLNVEVNNIKKVIREPDNKVQKNESFVIKLLDNLKYIKVYLENKKSNTIEYINSGEYVLTNCVALIPFNNNFTIDFKTEIQFPGNEFYVIIKDQDDKLLNIESFVLFIT